MSTGKARQARKRRGSVAARSASARRLTARTLLEGQSGPPGYRLRLAGPQDGPAIARLMPLAGVEPEPQLLAGIGDGVCGDVARRTIGGQGSYEAAMVSHLHPAGGPGPDFMRALVACAAIVVATGEDDGEPVGICHTTPPGAVLGRLAQSDAPVEALYVLLMGVRRLSSVAVDPGHRGRGLGRALLELSTRLVFQLHGQVVYGHVLAAGGLTSWYRDAGFTVLAPGQGLSLSWLLNVPAATRPGPHEQLVVMMADADTPVPVLGGGGPLDAFGAATR